MSQVKCPFPLCDYETADLDAATVAALITTHSIIHNNAPTPVTAEKAPPRHLLAGEGWSYFLSRWTGYKSAQKLAGKELIIQLLECCDENLRKDLTRGQGGTLTDKPEADVLNAIR